MINNLETPLTLLPGPIIIITFGTTNVVTHRGITFGAGISFGSHHRDIVTVVLYQDINLVLDQNHSVILANWKFTLCVFFKSLFCFVLLFNAKSILLDEQKWYYLTHSWEDGGSHTFPKGICRKINVIVRLVYELAYYDSTVQCFYHYTTRRPLKSLRKFHPPKKFYERQFRNIDKEYCFELVKSLPEKKLTLCSWAWSLNS